MIEHIKKEKLLLGIIIRGNYLEKKGINFFTNNKLSQQVAFANHPKDYVIKAHSHKKIKRIIKGTPEVLIILSGKMKIYFYGVKGNYLFSKVVKKNDIIISIDNNKVESILEVSTYINTAFSDQINIEYINSNIKFTYIIYYCDYKWLIEYLHNIFLQLHYPNHFVLINQSLHHYKLFYYTD